MSHYIPIQTMEDPQVAPPTLPLEDSETAFSFDLTRTRHAEPQMTTQVVGELDQVLEYEGKFAIQSDPVWVDTNISFNAQGTLHFQFFVCVYGAGCPTLCRSFLCNMIL